MTLALRWLVVAAGGIVGLIVGCGGATRPDPGAAPSNEPAAREGAAREGAAREGARCSFGPPSIDLPGGITPERLFFVDVDGDGELDLLEFSHTYHADGTIHVALRRGATFVDGGRSKLPDLVIALAPVFTPGSLERAVIDVRMKPPSIEVRPAVGNTFPSPSSTTPLPFKLECAAIVDVDGDGILDVLSATNDSEIYFSRRNGAGFAPPVLVGKLFGWATAVTAGDLDNDGHPDIVSWNKGHAGDQTLTVFFGLRGPSFESPLYPIGTGPATIAPSPRGKGSDLVMARSIERNVGGRRFELVENTRQEERRAPIAPGDRGPTVGDIDGDGHLDILYGEGPDLMIVHGAASGFGATTRLRVAPEVDVDTPAWGETVSQGGRVADVAIDRSKDGEVRGLAVAIARRIRYLPRQCPPR